MSRINQIRMLEKRIERGEYTSPKGVPTPKRTFRYFWNQAHTAIVARVCLKR